MIVFLFDILLTFIKRSSQTSIQLDELMNCHKPNTLIWPPAKQRNGFSSACPAPRIPFFPPTLATTFIIQLEVPHIIFQLLQRTAVATVKPTTAAHTEILGKIYSFFEQVDQMKLYCFLVTQSGISNSKVSTANTTYLSIRNSLATATLPSAGAIGLALRASLPVSTRRNAGNLQWIIKILFLLLRFSTLTSLLYINR